MSLVQKKLWTKGFNLCWSTSLYLINFVTIAVVSSKPEVIFLPKCRYKFPKHCAAPTKDMISTKHK